MVTAYAAQAAGPNMPPFLPVLPAPPGSASAFWQLNEVGRGCGRIHGRYQERA